MARNKSIPTSQKLSKRGLSTTGRGRLLLGTESSDNSGGPLIQSSQTASSSSAQSQSGNISGGGLFGLGFLPDHPDARDHGPDHILNSKGSVAGMQKGGRPESVDLSASGLFGPVDAQGTIQCCTAQAVTSMAEYHIYRRKGERQQLSRLFLYKISRELLGVETDCGCTLRDTIKALNRYGCVLENRWPFDPAWLERLPRIPDLEEARSRRQFGYCRLDAYNESGSATLENVLLALAAGYPVAFGISICASIDLMGRDGIIPYPADAAQGRILGGHALLAVGYRSRGKRGGEILVRNSWGQEWGLKGYAWLPFEYIISQLCCDFWALYRPEEHSG